MSLFKYLPRLNQNTTVVLVLVATVFAFFPHITYASTIGSILWTLVNALFGWMVWVGGMMLNYSINEFVIGFGQMYQSSGLGNTIDSLWVIVRDIFNLTFIFGLVLIGLKMIFNSSDSNTKKMLVSLILAALLVNFSLFITKFVVDFANIASVQLVNAFPPNTSTVPSLSGKPDVAGEFMKLMGVSGLLNWGNNAGFSPTGNTYGGSDFGYILGTMILYVVTAFVFLAGGLLLMIRFVVLSLYLVLSPLIFLGWVFPAAAGLSKQYWSGFLGQAFFAPAYILMLYFAQKILSTFNVTAGGGKTLSSMFSNNANTNFADVFPPFILTAIFLIAALVIAKKMGANGASAVVAFGNSMANNMAVKAKRIAADKTIGVGTRTVAKGLNSNLVTRANARLNTASGLAGKLARAGVAGASLGTLSKRNRQAIIQGSNDWSIAGSKSLSARKKEDAAIRTTDAKILAAAKTQKTIDEGMDTAAKLAMIRARQNLKIATPAELASLPGLEKIEQDMMSAIAGMAIGDLEKLSPKDWADYVPHLTSSQIESAMKSENIDEQTKGNIIGARQNAIENVIGKTGAILTKELGEITIDQIEIMGADWIRKNAHLLTSAQIDEIKNSKKFNPAQKSDFIARRKSEHTTRASSSVRADHAPLFFHTNAGKSTGVRRKPADVAALGPAVLLEKNIVHILTPEILEAILKKETLDKSQRATLEANIASSTTPNVAALKAYLATSYMAGRW